MPITMVEGDNDEREGEARERKQRGLLLGSGLAGLAEASEELGGAEGRALAFSLLAALTGLLVGTLATGFGAGGVRHRSTPV